MSSHRTKNSATFSWQFPRSLYPLNRILAAGVGGYLTTSALIALAAIILPLPAADSTLLSMMLAFAIWCGFALWAFAARSATWMWAVMTVLSLGSCAIIFLLQQRPLL
ncbi:hypothetical protein [Shewanella sp. NFH-SH190041]|uniref:hypothetical protein n=1 Tax=Shewanella sp. NFH-SH190041 TaxID=2950245 RepID=UPI0021C2AD8C|nr:hypothetical protein [Shewanella sp. NFH-SH190041]